MALVSGAANRPALPAGWTPVNHSSGHTFVDTTLENWDIDYSPAGRKWANARDTKGNLWVWIPRFTYKTIAYLDDPEIKIRFSNGIVDDTTAIDGKACKKHSAFRFGTHELTGIWFPKYAAHKDTANGDIPGFKPDKVAWREITVNDIFTQCINLKNHITTNTDGVDSHMVKNIEWGAAAMLAYAVGEGRPKINGDSSYKTGYTTNGQTNTSGSLDNIGETSTTGNMTGIFDMVGNTYEYVASYVNNGHSNLNSYCKALVDADAKYKDVFPKGAPDDRPSNYAAAAGLTDGMMIHETSTAGEGSTSWKNWNDVAAYSYFPYSSVPVFHRGGVHSSSVAGLACFSSSGGGAGGYYGFRACFVVLNSAPLISGNDENLGDKKSPITITYQVSDVDGDEVSIEERLNSTVLRTIDPADQGVDYTIELTTEQWNNLELNTTHTISIKATDEKGNVSIRTYTFKKVNAVPTAPTIVFPTAGETLAGTINLQWTEAEDPDGDPLTYKVYYSDDEGVTKTEIATGISGTSVNWDTSLAPEGNKYKIFVCANDGKVDGPFASSGMFSIVHNYSPEELLLQGPVNTARVPLNPVFIAKVGVDPEGDPQFFRLQIATDENFLNLVEDIESATRNLLTPNQADVEFDTDGFTAKGSQISRSTDYKTHGAASLKVTTNGAMVNEGVNLDPVDVISSKRYSAQVNIIGAGYVRLAIEELDANGNYLRSTGSEPVTLDGVEWTTLKVTAQVGPDCKKVRLSILTSSVVGATFYCDEFMLVKGSELPGEFVPGGMYAAISTSSAISGFEIYDGSSWVQLPATGAPAETERVRHTLQDKLQQNVTYYWRMAAKDDTGQYSNWTLPRVIRAGNVLRFSPLPQPIETSAEVHRVLVMGYQNIARDGQTPAQLKVEACNNGFDPFPTWEDITAAYLAKGYAELKNRSKTSDKWGLNVRKTVYANDSLGPIEDIATGISFD